jgi:hypothetical protein
MTTRRTNNGVMLDMDALLAQQPASVKALGNMGVNAQGDVIDSAGNVVKRNEDRVREYYKSNPKSSTKAASLKGRLAADVDPMPNVETETAKTIRENARVAAQAAAEQAQIEIGAADEWEEVELPNGDFEMVPKKKKGKK